jgi:hypothetical protein
MIPNPSRRHPNASLGGTGGTAGVALVWLLTSYAHMPLNATQGAAVATGSATAFLVIGRHGFKGIWRILCDGVGQGDET